MDGATRATKEDNTPAVLVTCLLVLATAVAAAGVLGGLLWMLMAMHAQTVNGVTVLQAGGILLGSLCVAGGLWGFAWLVRHLTSGVQAAPLLPRRPGPCPQEAPPPPADAKTPKLLQANLDELEEVNANLLLTPEQMEMKRRARQAELAERIAAEFDASLAEKDFGAAQKHLEHLSAEVPDFDRRTELADRLAAAREAAQAEDIQTARRRAEDLMAVASFEKALALAEELLAAHPSAPEAIGLLDRVRREQEAFTTEQRGRMYAEVEQFAAAKQWRKAVASGRRLMDAYPQSAEAETVAIQMGTLEDNARLEEVRDLRDRFRDLLERRRYVEAIDIARDLIERFPDTQAASDLKQQMPRLKELASGEPRR